MATVLRPEEGKTAGDRLELEIFGEIHAFRYCPPGTFLMGSPEDEEGRCGDENQHEVTLTRGFWLGETPVTQRQWETVMGENPSFFYGDDLPVEWVSWYDCERFFEIINERAPTGYCFTFPTEAQWEYACRAGTSTPFSFGNRCSGIECNCDGNFPYGYGDTRKRIEQVYLEKTTPVRSYPANPWGFYDMHGNVWEWCADWYDGGFYNTDDAKTDPAGPPRDDAYGVFRVFRGGSWRGNALVCRSAFRRNYELSEQDSNFGFRTCLVSSGK